MKQIFTLFFTAVIFFGCSSVPKNTGFFKSYEGLREVSENLYFEKMLDANLSKYNKIYIEDILVLPNTRCSTPQENKLYAQISSYATPAYRKIISKNSSNYKLVDVAQKDTMVMQIAISMVKITSNEDGLYGLRSVDFSINENTKDIYKDEKARLLIEVKTTDAMTGSLLARSVRVVMDQKVVPHDEHFKFKDVQAALDSWLSETIK